MKRIISFVLTMMLVIPLVFTRIDVKASDGEWSEWSTTAAPADATQVEKKLQYSYRDKQTTTSGYDSLDGWTKQSTTTVSTTYGGWGLSAPTTGTTTTSENKTVITSETATSNRSYVWYCKCKKWCWKNSGGTCGSCGGKTSNLLVIYSSKSLAASGYKKDTDGSYFLPKTIGVSSPGKLGTVYCMKYAGSMVTSFTTNSTKGNIFVWPSTETPTVKVYRSKTVKTYNNFYKWTNWSSWGDVPITSGSTREVQTRMLYRYRYSSSKRDPGLTYVNKNISKYVNSSNFINVLTYKTDGSIRYSSSNPGVAVVNETTGEVDLISEGVALIYANVDETDYYLSGTDYYVVYVSKQNQTITGTTSYSKYYGSSAFYLNAVAKTSLSYKTSNSKVATVNSSGKVTIKGKGTATITVTAAANYAYNSAVKKVKITTSLKKPVVTVENVKTRKLKISWKPSPKCSSYAVYLYRKSGGKYKYSKKSTFKRTYCSLTNCKKGAEVKIIVKAKFSINGKTYYADSSAKYVTIKK